MDKNNILENYIKDNFNHYKIVFTTDNDGQNLYCYSNKYKNEIYIQKSNIELLNNLNELLQYVYVKNNYHINKWTLIGDNIFFNNFYFLILDVFYLYIKNLNYDIIIEAPTNLKDLDKCKFVSYFNQFQQIKCKLTLTYVTNGKYGNSNIERIDWDSNFKFCATYNIPCQTMIDPSNVHNWRKNYIWWKKQYKKYFKCSNQTFPNIIETQNGNWSEQNLHDYCLLITKIVYDKFKLCGFNKNKMAQFLWGQSSETLKDTNLILLNNNFKKVCSIKNCLSIDINSLNIIPCPRLGYHTLQIGQFTNKQIESKNITTGLHIWTFNPINIPGCHSCVFHNVCQLPCLGSSYEEFAEMFIPIEANCMMQQIKIIHLYMLYKKLGIIKVGIKQNLVSKELQELFNYIEALIESSN